jgi:HK97 family phage portal protein
VTTLQTADGRLLRAQRPPGAWTSAGGFFPASFPPLWSNGETVDGSASLVSYEQIFRSQPVVAAAVNKLTRRIATLPLDAYKRTGDNAREVVRGDTLDSLIKHPMPRWGTTHLVAHIAQSLLTHGNAIVAKVRSNGPDEPPDRLWPLNWAYMNAYGPIGGTIEWWSTTQFEGVERFVATADTVHFAWPGPDGGELGVSPLEQLGITLRIEDAAQREQTAMFRNGIRPSAAVAVEDEKPTREKLLLAKEFVESAHKGMDKSGSWLFTGANTTVTPLTWTPVEAALMEQRQLSREEVGMVYDLAGPLINDLTHGTYSNVAELLKGLYRDVIPPWTTLIVETLQSQLLDPEPAWLDRLFRFDFTDKLRGDPAEMATSLKTQVEAGLITRNEGREVLGKEPDGNPDDPENPANQLSANLNNQGPIAAMSGDGVSPPASPASQG